MKHFRGSRNDPPVQVEPPSFSKVELGAAGVADAPSCLEDQQRSRGVVPDLLAVALWISERGRERKEEKESVSFFFKFPLRTFTAENQKN